MQRVVVHGYYGARNLGDEAILDAIVCGLRQRIEQLHVTVFSLDPEDTLKYHAVDHAIYAPSFPFHRLCQNRLAIMKALRATDLYVLGGGGLFHGYCGTVRHWLEKLCLAKLLGNRTMIYALGVDPSFALHKRWIWMWRVLSPFADVISVRDEGSRDVLCGIRARKEVLVVPDPAFGLEPASVQARELVDICERKKGRPIVGFAPGLSPNLLPLDLTTYTALMADAADYVVEKLGAYVILIPYDTLPGRDREMCLEILARMRHKNDADVLLRRYRPSEILALTGHLDLAICTRLHAHIFAVRSGTPFVSIVYLAKVQKLLKSMQLETLGTNIQALGKEVLVSKIDDVWSEREDLSKRLSATGLNLGIRSQRASDIAAKLVVGGR